MRCSRTGSTTGKAVVNMLPCWRPSLSLLTNALLVKALLRALPPRDNTSRWPCDTMFAELTPLSSLCRRSQSRTLSVLSVTRNASPSRSTTRTLPSISTCPETWHSSSAKTRDCVLCLDGYLLDFVATPVAMTLLGLPTAPKRQLQRNGTGSSDTPAAKSTKKDSKDSNDMAIEEDDGDHSLLGLVGLTARLALTATHVANSAASTSIDVLLLPRDSLVVTSVKQAMKDYHESAIQNRGKSGQKTAMPAPPHVYAWDKIIDTAKSLAETHKQQDLLLLINKYTELIKSIREVDMDEMVDFVATTVKICRVNRCHDPQLARIEVSISPVTQYLGKPNDAAAIWHGLMSILVKHCRAQKKYGLPPKSNIERKLVQKLKHKGLLQENANRHQW
eukprot:TRINITY_DN913_c0_g1_i6.p3 TRINITY_DN913_c0_g1~~TRINITY_DN913_c0_g1_i6.p3  ORF type:complete len:390 (-),score=45.59 TRINITY_DN913_c0_g1_i6:968-2137(-)